MPWHSDDAYYVSVEEPAKLKALFEALGLVFVEEKHGDGPTHWACERDGRVFEIYPKAAPKDLSR